MIQKNIPDDYYANYFLQMIDLVYKRYHDILNKEDRNFIQAVLKLNPEALRLLVRLYLRKGPNFLSSKLTYREIPDIAASISELSKQKLIEINPLIYAFELVDLLPIAQSRLLLSGGNPKIKKTELYDLWLENEKLSTCTDWGVFEEIITPLNYENYRRIQLLYFSNEQQNLTDFILEDLGLFQYEKYELNVGNRYFKTSNDIDNTIALNDLANDFFIMNDTKSWQTILELADSVVAITPSLFLKPRWDRLVNRIAYRLEQMNELDFALQLFNTNKLPPSRERKARIFFKQERFRDAFNLLEAIEIEPFSADEAAFYKRFINKVNKKLSLPNIIFNKPNITQRYETWVRAEGTVEQQACVYLGDAAWLENSLPLAVFGLIYWDVIFANIAGVWHHPFQSGPSDLYDSDFVSKREIQIDNVQQYSRVSCRNEIIEKWQEKADIRNPFVNWNNLTLDIILKCYDALTLKQWQGVFDHLLIDIKNHRSGFPDLFQVTSNNYCFIEIKGPGDKLQDNQILWLAIFDSLNIQAEVCYVSYLNEEL